MNTKATLIAIAALMMAACTQKENPVEERTPVTLQFTTVDATETRAEQNLNEGTFASGESVKVRISNTGAGEWTDYDFTTGSAGAMSPASTIPYYPAGAQNIDIVAYYPVTAGTSFSVQADQTADADYKASDLMFASVSNQAKQAEAVNLAFTHKMAKINVNISAGTGVESITSVSLLNVKPTVSFDRATGEAGSATGSATSIAMSNNGAAVIPAQTIDGGLLSIVTDKGTATYTVASKEFAAAQQYTINITVNLRAIGSTNAITGWTSEGTVTVYADRPNIAGHEYVEMGDGLKWATCNMGASDPWEYGDYYAWGATVPFYLTEFSQWINGKTAYDWANYPFMQAGYSDYGGITKYTYSDGQYYCIWYDGDGNFIGDDKTSFAGYDYADDAARQRWGDTWRIPTDDEWTALRNTDNYSWEWKKNYMGTGKYGMLITRLTGPCSGNSIFLPAAGYRDNYRLYNAANFGLYWSSSLVGIEVHSADLARSMTFALDMSNGVRNQGPRYLGYSLRPVSE